MVAVTLLVFAGGKDEPAPGPAPQTSAPTSACQTATGTNCVQAAKDLVNQSNSPAPSDPAATGLP